MLRFAVGRSGGITYHLKGYRYADSRWLPFRSRVREFLATTWAPTEPELVIFGPSAGWTLPFDWLSRFEKIVAVEPDPVARWLFARDFPHAKLEFETSPKHLPWFSEPDRAERALADFLELHPRAAVLFANVIGQVGGLLELDESRKDRAREIFAANLLRRNWASFHDVLSSSAEFKRPWPEAKPKDFDVESLARHFYSGSAMVVDHETTWLSTLHDRETDFAGWKLSPQQNHLIGFVSGK